jgi:hypothetical protein
MGVSQSSCVSLRELDKYTSESYTVKRTSGDLDDGWRISNGPHHCANAGSGWVGGHANRPEGVWRVFMSSPIDMTATPHDNAHACGWRRHGTFFPTRIKDQDAEIKSWQDSFLGDLEALHAAKAEESEPKVEPKVEPKLASVVEAAVKADKAIAEAKAMTSETDFAKNLFMTVQGVKHDALCPHGLPYYACMSCSH